MTIQILGAITNAILEENPAKGEGMSHYVHDIPGRLRVKTHAIKGSKALAQELEEMVRTIPGVSSADANALTGSIVVTYDSSITSSKDVLDVLVGKGYFDPARAVSSEKYMEEKFCKTGSNISLWLGKALLGCAIKQAFSGTPLAVLSAIF